MKSCCFTGHRVLKNIVLLRRRLTKKLGELIEDGVTDFYAGGAFGFDMLCERTVAELKKSFPDIRLHLILPCPPGVQSGTWNAVHREEYDELLALSDDVEIISEKYSKSCMKARNQRLVDSADCCVCYFTEEKSGTGQTVRMALKKGITVINLAEDIT